MKFSRLISVTSASARRASVLSRYIAALSPANPSPKITMLVFFIRPPRLPTIVDAVAGLTFHGELQRHLSFYLSLPRVFYRACDAASSIRAATSFGLET